MTTIVTRTGKGSPLTHVEVDTNFTNLNTNKLEAGAIALGSAATPSISFTGDTNTGIYSPGADQVAVATNGTQRLNIGSTGHIANSRSIATAFSGANAATWTNGLTLANAATPGAGVSNLIVFEGTSNVNAVFGVTQAGSTYGDFVWAAYNGSFSETMRLTSAGLLGIGTSAPASALDVSGGSIKLRNASSGTNYGYEVDINHVSGVSQKMLTARYMIAGASGSYTEIAGINAEIENADTNVYGMSFRTGGSLTEHVRIDGSGRLLVGTSSTSGENCTLQVRNNSALAAEFFTSSDDTAGPYIHLTKSRGTAASPTEVSSGDTLGAIAFFGYDGSTYRTAARIVAEADGTWTDGGDTTDNPGRLVFSTTPDGGSSQTSSPPAMTIKSSQEVLIGTSTITANGGVLQLKSGITFPATAVAATDVNTLDDYEEGTWTPTQGAGLTVVGTFSSAGHYTKVGRQVTVQGALSSTTTVAAAANAIMCGGLPFGVMNISGSNFIGGGSNVSLSALINVWANQGTANMYSVTAMAATAYLVFTVSYFTD